VGETVNTLSVVIGIFAIGAIIGSWYILQPVVYSVLYRAEQTLINMEANRTESATLYDILEYINNLWGPALAVILVVFMLISAQQRSDYSSQYEQPF